MEPVVLSCGGEFIAQESEAKYRADRLPEYIRHTRLLFLFAALINSLFFFNDWRFHGHSHFYFAVSARTLIVLASLVCFAVNAKTGNFRSFQTVCIAWACLVIPASAVLVSPHTDVALLVTFVLPILFFLALPVSFRWAVVFGITCSLATLGAYISSHPHSETNLGLGFGMLTSNIIFTLVLRQSNRLRRLEWSATLAERMANEKLSASHDILRQIVMAIPIPLIITARESHTLLQANDAARSYFGADLLDNPLRLERYVDHHDLARLDLLLRSDGHALGFETRLHMADNSIRDVLLSATEVVVADREAVLTVLVDITRRKEVEVLMEKLANTDPLSGLPNRACFFTSAVYEIKRAARYGHPLAVFMVDIDFFKRINDTHGHEIGDLALKAFAKLCRTWVRGQDMVARLGGEEFGFLLPETDASSALALANRLRTAVEDLRMEKLTTPMTISIGVSEVLPGEEMIDARCLVPTRHSMPPSGWDAIIRFSMDMPTSPPRALATGNSR
mgnify:CR=1 FL=1